MIPQRKHHQEDNVDSWLMSYADMITLLMCFFIIFVSVSEPKRDKFSQITHGLANKFGAVDLSTPFNGVFQSLQALVESRQLARDIVIEKGERSIDMDLASGVFFKPGSAEFDEKNQQLLTEMVVALQKINFMDYNITIEAHTDDTPLAPGLYASNWELSAARAAHMARFFTEQGIEARRIKPIGYGAARPKVPNADANGTPIPANRARNQRIIVKVERVL